MHVVTIPIGISESLPVMGGNAMEAGKSYICTNAFAGSLLQSDRRCMIADEMWKLSPLFKAVPYLEETFDHSVNWNGLHIWLMRGGGWGDLLMLTPLIRELKKKWPTCTIHVARGGGYASIFEGLDVIEEQIPIEVSRLDGDAILVCYEEWIEGHPDAEKHHMAQHFANKLAIDLNGDYKPDYVLFAQEKEWATESYPKTDKKRIGIQYAASAMYRTYPMEMTDKVIRLLLQEGVEVFLFGKPGQIELKGEPPPGLTNLTAHNLNFRQSVAVASTCDCIISPDSAMVHVASALAVPYVGLYGPISAELRCSGRHGKGLQGVARCSPCFYHAARPGDFPAGMPCEETQFCIALAQIKPEQIAETAMSLASPIIQLAKPKLRGNNIIQP